jgi:hypothetical protein
MAAAASGAPLQAVQRSAICRLIPAAHGRAGPVARCRRRSRQRHGHHAFGPSGPAGGYATVASCRAKAPLRLRPGTAPASARSLSWPYRSLARSRQYRNHRPSEERSALAKSVFTGCCRSPPPLRARCGRWRSIGCSFARAFLRLAHARPARNPPRESKY